MLNSCHAFHAERSIKVGGWERTGQEGVGSCGKARGSSQLRGSCASDVEKLEKLPPGGQGTWKINSSTSLGEGAIGVECRNVNRLPLPILLLVVSIPTHSISQRVPRVAFVGSMHLTETYLIHLIWPRAHDYKLPHILLF